MNNLKKANKPKQLKKGTSNLYTMQELIENTKRMKDQKPTRMIDLYEFKRK